MNRSEAQPEEYETVASICTPALDVQTASIVVNPAGTTVRLTRRQLSKALRVWGKGDQNFIPDFVESKIVSEDENVIIKEIRHYGKSIMADGSPNLQRTSFRGDALMVTEYLAGPWFMAIACIEEAPDDELKFLLTTLRHTQHPDYLPPATIAEQSGAKKPPPTTEQNARRVLGIIRNLAERGEL